MKGWYDAARHLVWVTQFGVSVCMPLLLCTAGSVWLRQTFSLGGWVVLAGVLLGVLGAVGGMRASLRAMNRQGKSKPAENPPVFFDRHR